MCRAIIGYDKAAAADGLDFIGSGGLDTVIDDAAGIADDGGAGTDSAGLGPGCERDHDGTQEGGQGGGGEQAFYWAVMSGHLRSCS